jgi:hypothetical protein
MGNEVGRPVQIGPFKDANGTEIDFDSVTPMTFAHALTLLEEAKGSAGVCVCYADTYELAELDATVDDVRKFLAAGMEHDGAEEIGLQHDGDTFHVKMVARVDDPKSPFAIFVVTEFVGV